LLVLFLVTMLFAQVITSYGAAVLMFPITMATAESLGVNPEPFVLSLMVAAGSTYLTPVAYQTNLMVYGPGGYRFFDYTRLGAPLVLLIALICLICAPMFFPF
jgi:di/tricarboxylate transporter